ncbi:MAG: nucleotidyltransferase family protein [Burkholderiales bacterium]|nr:nucleotidyltransferase family protein [Burkholderiales bacterium]
MLAGLILAAGQSTRFGGDKRQALLPSGQSMLDTVLTRYRTVLERLVVVIPPDDTFAYELCLQRGAEPVINPEAHLGMGRSLAAGLAHIQTWPHAADWVGVVVGLADMPAVPPLLIHQIGMRLLQSIHEEAPGRPVAPTYQGQLGHPRGIPAHLWPALMQLRGDEGAKAVLNWSQAIHLEVDQPGVLIDIDTPQDLLRL